MSQDASKSPDLTETQVIVIGCVCAVILIALLIILLCIILKRRQRNKNYNGNVSSARPIEPENGAILKQKSNTYENQDGVDIDNRNGGLVEPYLTLGENYFMHDTSHEFNFDIYENEMNRCNANHSIEPVYNGKQDLSFSGSSPRTPTKDFKQFIALPEEHAKEAGSFGSGNESGYSTTDRVKPSKKVIYEVVV